jgi:predicted dehydrogenase
LLCEAAAAGAEAFPWVVRVHRIAPGQKNNWYVEVYGTRASARWTSVRADLLEVMEYDGGEQTWRQIQMGHETAFKSITAPIFQFGFSDAILQMWAAFMHELIQGRPLKKFASCLTPEEALLSHRLFTAALESQKNCSVVSV